MLLIDVGNTNISCAYSRAGKIVETFCCTKADYKAVLASILEVKGLNAVVVSSVVPVISKGLRSLAKKYNISYYECGRELTIPVKNLYRDPSEVGQDRLLNVYAVNQLYKGKNVRLVIDLGTALTFDFITVAGAYQGGLIFPGMQTALDSLLKTCSLLPDRLKLEPTRTLQAKTTIEGINNGIDYGYSFLIAGMIDHLRKSQDEYKTLVTGGGSKLLIKKICKFEYSDDKLALKGLNQLAKKVVLSK